MSFSLHAFIVGIHEKIDVGERLDFPFLLKEITICLFGIRLFRTEDNQEAGNT